MDNCEGRPPPPAATTSADGLSPDFELASATSPTTVIPFGIGTGAGRSFDRRVAGLGSGDCIVALVSVSKPATIRVRAAVSIAGWPSTTFSNFNHVAALVSEPESVDLVVDTGARVLVRAFIH